jgi:hypothetical protein
MTNTSTCPSPAPKQKSVYNKEYVIVSSAIHLTPSSSWPSLYAPFGGPFAGLPAMPFEKKCEINEN